MPSEPNGSPAFSFQTTQTIIERANGRANAIDGRLPDCAVKRIFRDGRERTNAAASGTSSSAWRRNRAQDIPENAVLQLKRLGAVVLIVPRSHDDSEIEFADNANRLPTPAKPANPLDRASIEP